MGALRAGTRRSFSLGEPDGVLLHHHAFCIPAARGIRELAAAQNALPRPPRTVSHERWDHGGFFDRRGERPGYLDRKSTRLNSSHGYISYAVFCLKKKKDMCFNY